MEFHWLEMRIGEEKERRQREAETRARLPRALREFSASLTDCVEAYRGAFGPEAAELETRPSTIRVTVREEGPLKWRVATQVEIGLAPELPGFRIDRAGDQLMVEVGMLPGDKMYYKVDEAFLTLEDLTRRTLDRAFFPKLAE